VLLNEQATRENILNALRRRVDQLRAGDHLFFVSVAMGPARSTRTIGRSDR
jgi:hypothetical protein